MFARLECYRAAVLLASIPAVLLAREPIELVSGEAPWHPQQPQAAVDGRGAIHVVYGIGDLVRYQRSVDNGKTFAQPVDLPAVNAMSLGMRRGPRVAATSEGICVTAIGGKQGRGRDGDVLAFHSADGGRTWAGPTTVNDVPDAAREGLHAMAAGPKGEIYCVWLDLRHQRTEVMASVSTNGGKTWAKSVLVYQSPDGSVCECCHPSVASDPRGDVFVQWRNSLAGARDMYVASSSDGGKTFGQASKLGEGTWPLQACPMDGGAIAATAPGKFATTWRREKAIFLTTDDPSKERRLGDGEQPWIAATTAGPFVVWVKKRGDTAYLLKPNSRAPIPLSAHAYDPVIASGPLGAEPVVVMWEEHSGRTHTIKCAVVVE